MIFIKIFTKIKTNSKNSKFYNSSNKMVIGKMKDVSNGNPVVVFDFLRFSHTKKNIILEIKGQKIRTIVIINQGKTDKEADEAQNDNDTE